MAVSAAFFRQIWQFTNREVITNKSISRSIGVGFFVIATALGAFVRIPLPFTPVPVTLQTFFVMLSGAALGRKFGSTSQLIYLTLGCAGLPIFTGGGSGLAYLFGPTGGYLVGFVLSAYIIGTLITKRRGLLWILFSFLAGEVVLFSTGMLWLSFYMKISLPGAFSLGVLPFIFGDAAKLFLAAAVCQVFQKRFSEIF